MRRPTSPAGLSFLGRTKDGRHIVCLGLRVLSERCGIWSTYGPPSTQTQNSKSESEFNWACCCLPLSLPVGAEGNRKPCCMHYCIWCHDMTAVMPCVKWQPSIFAKLLPAFPKEGTKNDFKCLIWTIFRNIFSVTACQQNGPLADQSVKCYDPKC